MVDQAEIDARAREIRDWYEGHVFKCQMFQDKFETHLTRAIVRAGLEDADVEARTKSVTSLVDKAVKVLPSGDFKYADPRAEITDTVGVRIRVPLSTDLTSAAQLVRELYEVEEESDRGDEEAHLDVPGYRSLHFLVHLKDRDRQDPDFLAFGDMRVEVQIRTTLQHAWASLQHDVMYKTERPPTPSIRRRLVALAGLLELADREFVQVRQAHADIREPTGDSPRQLAGRITASSLRHLAETLFGEEDPASQEWFVRLKDVVAELQISTAEELDLVLGPWRERASEVAAVVRRTQPWANTAFVLDFLVRLAMTDRYLALRPAHAPEDEVAAEDVASAIADFNAELDRVRRELSPT